MYILKYVYIICIYSKLAQPFKVPLTKTPFQSDIALLVKAAA